jgi:hypothetical protein
MTQLFKHKWFLRLRAVVVTLMVALIAILFLNSVVQIEAQGRTPDSETIYRGSLTVNGRVLAFGPVMVGPGGSIGIYNSDGDMVSGLDAYGNITATGRITAAGMNSDDLLRGFEDTQAKLVGSLAAVTTTITGTAVVATGPFNLMSGTCSLAAVPTTTVNYCALNETVGGNLEVIVYTSGDAVATTGAPVTWFAWVEDAD